MSNNPGIARTTIRPAATSTSGTRCFDKRNLGDSGCCANDQTDLRRAFDHLHDFADPVPDLVEHHCVDQLVGPVLALLQVAPEVVFDSQLGSMEVFGGGAIIHADELDPDGGLDRFGGLHREFTFAFCEAPPHDSPFAEPIRIVGFGMNDDMTAQSMCPAHTADQNAVIGHAFSRRTRPLP